MEEGKRLLRAASLTEERLKRVETGWETELRITTDAILPNSAADPHIAAGRLVVKRLMEDRPARTLHMAWRCDEPGQALKWWLGRKEALIDAVRARLQPRAPS